MPSSDSLYVQVQGGDTYTQIKKSKQTKKGAGGEEKVVVAAAVEAAVAAAGGSMVMHGFNPSTGTDTVARFPLRAER